MKIDIGLELAPLDSRDLELVRTWRNDHRIWSWTRQYDLISDVKHAAWFNRQSDDPTIKMYVVKRRVDGDKIPVGVCGLTSIDLRNRRAEFSLYIAPDQQRKGYGRGALNLLLMHAFVNIGLHQVWGESFDGNPAIKMFEALGFKRDGTRRQFYYKNGRDLDAHLFSILRDEWILLQQPSPPSPSAASSPMPPPLEPTSPANQSDNCRHSVTPLRQKTKANPAPSESLASSPTPEPGN